MELLSATPSNITQPERSGCRVGQCLSTILVCTMAVLGGCKSSPGSGTGTFVGKPACTLLCEIGPNAQSLRTRQVIVSERVDQTVGSGFDAFRSMAGPLGNPSITFSSNDAPVTYAVREAWLRRDVPAVFRAQATPTIPPKNVGGWNLNVQDPTDWLGTFGIGFEAGKANLGGDPADTVPQLMSLGLTNPQVFGCAGGRTQDDSRRTTWLIELTAPRGSDGVTRPAFEYIQDLLNGDAYFVANSPGPLVGPATPPTPAVIGPGDQSGNGSVQCAMTQVGDDVTTRELHMLVIRGGVLYHSVASNFSTVTYGDGTTSARFSTISPWGDVGGVLGGGFGNISGAAIVGNPSSVSVFFISDSGGRYRLWHTVRFSSGGGWRPPKDVLALSGDAPNGTVYQFSVGAGNCPVVGAPVWNDSNNEILVALWGGASPVQILVIDVVSTARQWRPGVYGIYSPWQDVSRSDVILSQFVINHVSVTGRPFRDDGKSFP